MFHGRDKYNGYGRTSQDVRLFFLPGKLKTCPRAGGRGESDANNATQRPPLGETNAPGWGDAHRVKPNATNCEA